MWRLNAVRHKARRPDTGLDEFKFKRRDYEKALRQARKDKQLVSKRLLNEYQDPEEEGVMDTDSTPMSSDQVVEMLRRVQSSVEDKAAHLRALRKALRSPETQLTFVKLVNSMHVLVGYLSGSNAQCRLEAVHCLHELSCSPHPNVGSACLPATPYLLTYLSGQSAKFTELCLYTLGNLCPESEVVREKLLAQGIVAALANCFQNQRCNLAVLEAVGFTLSQLLQAKDTAEKIVPLVFASGLIPCLISVLTPDPQFGMGPAIECAWCLHYLACSNVDNAALVTQGALSQCSSLLVALGGTVAKGGMEEGMELANIGTSEDLEIVEVFRKCPAIPQCFGIGVSAHTNQFFVLLIWPLLRCLGNLLVSGVYEGSGDGRILAALCVFTQAFLQPHPALARESLWVLNNLTADSSVFCSALLFLKMVPALIQLLPFSQGINIMVLRVLGNIAYNGTEYCLQLSVTGLLPALCATLKMADPEVVTLSLEVLCMLVVSSTQVAEELVRQNGLPLLEAIQYNSQGEMRLRASFIIDHHLPSHSMVESDARVS